MSPPHITSRLESRSEVVTMTLIISLLDFSSLVAKRWSDSSLQCTPSKRGQMSSPHRGPFCFGPATFFNSRWEGKIEFDLIIWKLRHVAVSTHQMTGDLHQYQRWTASEVWKNLANFDFGVNYPRLTCGHPLHTDRIVQSDTSVHQRHKMPATSRWEPSRFPWTVMIRKSIQWHFKYEAWYP